MGFPFIILFFLSQKEGVKQWEGTFTAQWKHICLITHLFCSEGGSWVAFRNPYYAKWLWGFFYRGSVLFLFFLPSTSDVSTTLSLLIFRKSEMSVWLSFNSSFWSMCSLVTIYLRSAMTERWGILNNRDSPKIRDFLKCACVSVAPGTRVCGFTLYIVCYERFYCILCVDEIRNSATFMQTKSNANGLKTNSTGCSTVQTEHWFSVCMKLTLIVYEKHKNILCLSFATGETKALL